MLAAQSQPEHKLNLPLAETPINIGTHRDYVALVNLSKYYHFIASDNGELRKYIFEANVRDYQGHNAVNQDIQNTLLNSTGEEFWWLNNGITLVADEAILATSKELILTEPAVVNGLQTSNEIYRYFQANPEKLAVETRNVLVRIIVPESENSRDKIILATNNQTNIPKSSLRANDPIHFSLKCSQIYSQAQINDILFYVLYYSVAKQVDKLDITATDIKKLDLSVFTNKFILESAEYVFSKYEELGGNSKVAKGAELIKSLVM